MSDTQRVAIVTGAAGGIGRAMTRGLLAADIRVAGVDRDREPLEALAANAREQGKGGRTAHHPDGSDPATPRPMRSPRPREPGSAASTSSSTTPGSARAPSDRIAGSARSSSGKSRLISGAALSLCTRRHRGRPRTPWFPK